MKTIDLNADLGEGFPFDDQLLQYVSSCNIACGGHAGDHNSMRKTIALAQKHKVNMGAHPSYPDTENFGRKLINMDAQGLLTSLIEQVDNLLMIAYELNAKINYIKPHGALYHKSMKAKKTARVLVKLIAHYNNSFALMGMPNSVLEEMCAENNILFIREGFADRRYTKEGQLMPRTLPEAVIHDHNDVWNQVHKMVEKNVIVVKNGQLLPVDVDSICFHGDTPEALKELQYVYQKLRDASIDVRSF